MDIFMFMNTTSLHPLLQKAASIQRMIRGSLSIIREGPEGPYYNHQCRVSGKNCTRYVSRDQVPAFQEAIEAHKQFARCVEEYVEQISSATCAEIAGESKKK